MNIPPDLNVKKQARRTEMRNRTAPWHALLATVLLFATCIWSSVGFAGEIDPDHKFAWAENVGWLNFKPSHGTVTVYPGHLEGHVWAENVGWISLGSHSGGGTHNYPNTSATNYGVNRSGNQLSGYAWGENIGWINFGASDHHGGVSIDMVSGDFSGYGWGENIGWIKLAGTAQDQTPYRVRVVVQQQNESIIGQITTAVTGQSTAVVGALVTMVGTGQTLTSDIEGRYVFDDVPAGTYTLKIEMAGFESAYLHGIEVIEGTQTNVPLSDLVFAQADECLPGDANKDGRLGLEDAVYILQVLTGIER
jgi:hypothetical protein